MVVVPLTVSVLEKNPPPATVRVVDGVLVPTPSRVFWVSRERVGVAVILVPNASALTAEGSVVVAVRW
jgi:hypothetical protein